MANLSKIKRDNMIAFLEELKKVHSDDAAHENNYTDYRIEGTRDSNWLLLDLGDVVVNVFTKEAREFYNLEKLWANGKQVELKED